MSYVTGRGGESGAGTGSTVTSDPNTLRNRSFMQGIDLLGEGVWDSVPIGGLQGVYIDGVAVQDPDGTVNYPGIKFDTRNGTVDQAPLSIAGNTTESLKAVGVEMTYNNPIITSVSGDSIDILKVVVALKGLYQTDSKTGKVTGSSVSYKIEYKASGSTEWVVVPAEENIKYAPLAYSPSAEYTGYSHYKLVSTIHPAEYFFEQDDSGYVRQIPCRYLIQVSEDAGSTWITLEEDVTTKELTLTSEFVTPTASRIKFRIDTTTIESFDPTTGTQIKTEYSSVSDLDAGVNTTSGGVQTITGKCSSAYEREHSFRVVGDSPFSVRLTRLTPDETAEYNQSSTVFQSVTTVVEEKFNYPHSVLVGWSVDASQFNNIPQRAYLCRMARVKVPSNYNPIMRTYSGVWLGDFATAPAWTDNPAWCFRDLLTNPRYGLGNRIQESAIDDAELYQIAQYCDELVPDGNGGYEPRFTCNLILQSQEQAHKVISDMASIFKGITYWAAGSIIPVQDSPKDKSYHFTNANVVDGMFTYQGSPANTRYNAVYVTWNDPDDQYRQAVEFVPDDDAIAEDGFLSSTNIVAIGCTSRGQARRAGKWLLYTNSLETDLVQFTTSLEGLLPKPGDIIGISDSLRSNDRRGGRIVSVTGTTVVLDAVMNFTPGIPYTLSVILNDGAPEDRTFYAAGDTNTIILESAFSKPVAEDSIFIVADSNIPEALFRVVSVVDNDDFKYQITATSYNPNKFKHIDRDEPLPEATSTTSGVGISTSFTATEMQYYDGISTKVKVECAWKAPLRASTFDVFVTNPDGTIVISRGQDNPTYTILEAVKGQYRVRVVAIDALNRKGKPYDNYINVLGAISRPSDIQGFRLSISGDTGILSWTAVPELDVRAGGNIIIKYSPDTVNVGWEDGSILAHVSGAATQCIVPVMTGTYMAKAVNASDKYSRNPAKATATQSLVDSKLRFTAQEEPLFEGAKTGCRVEDGKLIFDGGSGGSMYGVDAMYDVTSMFSLPSDVVVGGEYIFQERVTFDSILKGLRLVGVVNATIETIGDSINSRVTAVNTWDRWNGVTTGLESVKLWVSSTEEDPDDTNSTWSDWTEFVIGNYTGRGFRFKLTVEDIPEGSIVRVSSLIVNGYALRRRESGVDITVPSTGTNVVFNEKFLFTPAVTVRSQNQVSGDYEYVTNVTPTGFTVQLRDDNGTPKDGVIDYICDGYGSVE